MARAQRTPLQIERVRSALLQWYEANRRDLPWRQTSDPYAIWVSEIMLQQTRVAVVIERYKAFLGRFPNLITLATAKEQDVLALWSGLGYYRRARMLHKAAQSVAATSDGCLPNTARELLVLPGIGSYTAAAIASIAHGERIAVVDGNVERVLSRLQGWHAPTQAESATLRRKVETLADRLVDPNHPGDFNQALMELGATVCLPRNPQCLVCPLAAHCHTLGEHRTPPRARMVSREVASALAVRATTGQLAVADEVLLEQRPASNSVMADMWQLPVLRQVVFPAEDLRMTVRHAIMQVNYVVRVRSVVESEIDMLTECGGFRRWVPLDEAAKMALTGLTRKILSRAHLIPSARPATALVRIVAASAEK
jgi:A/G-specific adenine glycosylase